MVFKVWSINQQPQHHLNLLGMQILTAFPRLKSEPLEVKSRNLVFFKKTLQIKFKTTAKPVP